MHPVQLHLSLYNEKRIIVNGFGMSLTYKTIEPVDSTFFADYLCLKVNHFIGDAYKKFTLETADLFSLYFDGNLNELQEYMRSQENVQGLSSFLINFLYLSFSYQLYLIFYLSHSRLYPEETD